MPAPVCYGGGFALLSHLRFESYVNLAGNKAIKSAFNPFSVVERHAHFKSLIR